jgi:hypothetical protein
MALSTARAQVRRVTEQPPLPGQAGYAVKIGDRGASKPMLDGSRATVQVPLADG